MKNLLNERTLKILLVLLLLLTLILAAYSVFGEKASDTTPKEGQEGKIESLLVSLEEVSAATVAITERDGKAVSAVVVFRGEDGIATRLRIIEIVSSMLCVENTAVLVYPASGS